MIDYRYYSQEVECGMQRELIADLKTVYYRGRYRASVAWSKVGRLSTTEDVPSGERSQRPQETVVRPQGESKPRYQPVVS